MLNGNSLVVTRTFFRMYYNLFFNFMFKDLHMFDNIWLIILRQGSSLSGLQIDIVFRNPSFETMLNGKPA